MLCIVIQREENKRKIHRPRPTFPHSSPSLSQLQPFGRDQWKTACQQSSGYTVHTVPFPPNSKLRLCNSINWGEQKFTFYCQYQPTGLSAWHKIVTESINTNTHTWYICTYQCIHTPQRVRWSFSEGQIEDLDLSHRLRTTHSIHSSVKHNFVFSRKVCVIIATFLGVNEKFQLSTSRYGRCTIKEAGTRTQRHKWKKTLLESSEVHLHFVYIKLQIFVAEMHRKPWVKALRINYNILFLLGGPWLVASLQWNTGQMMALWLGVCRVFQLWISACDLRRRELLIVFQCTYTKIHTHSGHTDIPRFHPVDPDWY